jgi:predicted Zn-dependent peptidase
MNYTNNIKKFTILILVLFQFASICSAQTAKFSEPRQEKLLNGMKLLVWNEPGAEKITVKLRIHSGSAFDPLGKEGVMALLADALFPNESQKEFFAEDLGGSLDVTSNFDYIQINATGKSDQFLTIVETLATAVTNPQINKELTAKVVSARLAKVKELEKNPTYVADQAVAKRLFGDFPYGRAQAGTTASLEKIDFADLLFAKQKLLTADNATLAISGNVKPDLAYRAVRRYFGAWEKADKKVPATFRQPDAPKTGLPVFDSPLAKTSEFRFALRGLARNDKHFYASRILENILQNRLQLREGKKAFARQDAHLLPSYFIFGVSEWNLQNIKKDGDKIVSPVTDDYQNYFLKAAIKQDEFANSKNEFISKMNGTDVVDFWLDADTYKLVSAKTEWQAAQNVTLSDVQRVLEKLQKEAVAFVLVFSGDKAIEKSATSNQ